MCWCSAYKWRHLFCYSLAFTLQTLILQKSQCSLQPPSLTLYSALSFGKHYERQCSHKQTAANHCAGGSAQEGVFQCIVRYQFDNYNDEEDGINGSLYTIFLSREMHHWWLCNTEEVTEAISQACRNCSPAQFPNISRTACSDALLLVQLWRTELNRKSGQIECVPVTFRHTSHMHPCKHSCTTIWLSR